MLNLDSILKVRDITLLTKVHIVKDMVSTVVMYGCESWTIKKSVFWWSVVPFYCGGFSQLVGLDNCLVKVSWLGKFASVFWSVELDFFSLECNGVPRSEF